MGSESWPLTPVSLNVFHSGNRQQAGAKSMIQIVVGHRTLRAIKDFGRHNQRRPKNKSFEYAMRKSRFGVQDIVQSPFSPRRFPGPASIETQSQTVCARLS